MRQYDNTSRDIARLEWVYRSLTRRERAIWRRFAALGGDGWELHVLFLECKEGKQIP